MLDIKKIRENPQAIQTQLNNRNTTHDLTPILELDQQLKKIEQTRTELQTKSNEIGKTVAQKIQTGTNPNDPQLQQIKQQGNDLKTQLSQLEPQEKTIKTQLESLLLTLPNIPSETTPIGHSETDNIEIKRWGDEYIPTHQVLPHWEIGEKLGILNFEQAVKVAQTRFVTLVGIGAALERALIQFMLDRHIKNGYTEVMPPFLINTESLTATGQLPKFAQESFKCEQDDLWLTPTAEVPVTNLYRNQIIDSEQLPIFHCAYTPCFRREAGSYGRDSRGLIRLHQFNKIELVKFVHPNDSQLQHQLLLTDAEEILQTLELPYRVIELCTADLGFSAQKCYDIEVWLPSAGKYREISSCSNFGDFQARRANIRYKEPQKKGTQHIHTLNASALAVGRTMSAILENCQQPQGHIKIPRALQTILGRQIIS